MRATFRQRATELIADATTLYILTNAPSDASERASALVAVDRKSFAQRIVAQDLPPAYSIAIGDTDICLAEFGRTAAEVTSARVVAISKATGATRVAAVGIMNPTCIAADGTSFYVTDASGRLRRLAIPQ